MACGTGKTLTSLWIKEKIKAEQVLVLLPSLSLLSQTLKEWNAQANEPFKWICVCSDKSVAKDKSEDQWIANISEIVVPVTSEPLEIKNFLDESGSKVVFSTQTNKSILNLFRTFLEKVPEWNNELILNETDRIIECSKCDWLDELLTAVFISHTRILMSIGSNHNFNKINVNTHLIGRKN